MDETQLDEGVSGTEGLGIVCGTPADVAVTGPALGRAPPSPQRTVGEASSSGDDAPTRGNSGGNTLVPPEELTRGPDTSLGRAAGPGSGDPRGAAPTNTTPAPHAPHATSHATRRTSATDRT